MALKLDIKKLIEGLQYFLEVIKQFKCNTKDFYNFRSRFLDYLKRELFDKNGENLPRHQKVLISYLYGYIIWMNFIMEQKMVGPIQKNVHETTNELKDESKKLK